MSSISLTPFGSYVLGTFGLLGGSSLSASEAATAIDAASQTMVRPDRLEPALRALNPSLRAATRLFHEGLDAGRPGTMSPEAWLSLVILFRPTKEGVGIKNYFATVADGLVLGGIEAMASPEIKDENISETVAALREQPDARAEYVLGRLYHLDKTSEPFPVIIELLDVVQNQLAPKNSLRRLVLEWIGLNDHLKISIQEKEIVLNRLLDAALAEEENPILRDGVVRHWVKQVPAELEPDRRLDFFLAWEKRAEITRENFEWVFRVAKYMYRTIPPIVMRRFFRSYGKEIAEDSKAKLFLWLYHGEEGDYDAFARWRVPQSDYTPAEPELSELNEAWRSLEMMIRAHAKAKPFRKVRVGDREFEMSKVLSADGRDIAVGLVPCEMEGGVVFKARLFYHSRSQGRWRVSPFLMGGKFIKGDHYTAETQLHSDLLKYLSPSLEALDEDEELLMERDEVLEDSKTLLNLFDVNSAAMIPVLNIAMQTEAREEMRPYASKRLEGIRRYQPGDVYHRESDAAMLAVLQGKRLPPPPTPHTLERLSYPEGFLPDYNRRPRIESTRDHPLLGMYDTYIYEGGILGGQPIEWGFGIAKGRVWIEFIRFCNGMVNSYGSSSTYIDAGILQMKPLEYSRQLDRLDPKYSLPFDGDYEDLAPILLALKPIREFIRHFPDRHYQFPPLTSLVSGWNSENGILRLPPVDKPLTLRLQGLPEPELDFQSEKGVEVFQLRYAEDKILHISRKPGKSFMEIRGKVGDFSYQEVRIAESDSILQAMDRFRYTCLADLGRSGELPALRREEEQIHRAEVMERFRKIEPAEE